MRFFKSFIALLLLCMQQVVFAQGQSVEMADAMRSNGKIYVVVAVLVIILAGILFYLINTERKLKKLEDDFEENNS